MLYRLVLVFVVLVAVAGPARAEPTTEPRAGTEGTITAWDSDRTRVLGVRACARRREGFDYVSCERSFRLLVQTRLCARRGRGKHTYYLQLGAGPRAKSSLSCD